MFVSNGWVGGRIMTCNPINITLNPSCTHSTQGVFVRISRFTLYNASAPNRAEPDTGGPMTGRKSMAPSGTFRHRC